MASCVSSLCFCALWVAVMLGLGVHCDDTESLPGAYAPGDIVLGILASVHSKVKDLQDRVRPDKYTCTDFDLIPFVHSLATIYTIEKINDSGFLPGIRLGYLICDPCVYSTKALQCVEHMLSINKTLAVLTDNSNFSSPVKAFLGERYSELSIPVAKLLSIYMIPQISCTSSSPALSDKSRYAAFFRVIPSDVYQTKALAKLMKHFNWDWVGVVTIDDEYGEPALQHFLVDSGYENICVEFQEVLPNYLGSLNIERRIKEVADVIRRSTAKVVLLILRPEHVEMLFQELIKTNTSRIWIASDAWSTARFVMKMKDINKVGDIFGFDFVTGIIPGFEDYLQNLTISPGVRNDFIREYKQLRFNCSQQSEHTSPLACNVTDPLEANDDYLLHAVHLMEAYGQRVAVYAAAHAIRKLLKCNDTACSGAANLLPWQLVDILHKVNFTLDNKTYAFNQYGDFENGYDLIMWKKSGDEREPDVVGRFLIENGEVEIDERKIPWANNTVPLSRCSEPCPPGTEKNISKISCCYDCANCSEGYYSNETDQLACKKCPEGSGSLPGSRKCQKWNIWFLEWSSAYSIVVMIGTVIGALLLVFSFIFYILHREKPIIKDILVISCLMKFGLMVSFGGVILFLGSPNIHVCRAQQTMYGLGFTLCVSCILVKAFHTFLAYMAFNPDRLRTLRRLDKPFVIIGILTVIQALICIFWMIFDPVDFEEKPSKTQSLTMNRLCTQGSMYGFGAMHVYIALLAVLSFGLAFKGRDNETDPIVFSMLIHLFAWFCFIPVFITQYDSRPIVQISAIMVSSYGVIFCHLAPKWFKILSEKSEILKAVKLPVDSHTDDHDSGVVCRSLRETVSIPSISQSQFSIAESGTSNWDINSLHLSEVSVASFRRRKPRSQRPRSL
ncbi:G-protein coupled receptor family C group 6 member A-like [Colossoma macropomum]|uniref:G-protein coupled receptor family C group 6 member A-like n=1 Tax=Colossoma macropomum TaxID=42526 RepID=UPI001863B15A|nr:G-protein coupled receptor family C group 6 member A-like [Colossoma macropomum]